MKKIKPAIITFLTLFIVGCPSIVKDIHLHLDDFTLQSNCSGENINYCDEDINIFLDFKTSEVIISKNSSINSFGSLYANPVPNYFIENKVIECRIINLKEFNGLPINSQINEYFQLSINKATWVNNLSIVEAINEAIIVKEKLGDYTVFFKQKKKIGISYSGKITIELELANGTILTKTTNNIFITSN